MAKTRIEWAQSAHTIVHGCRPVSPGCLNCYAARAQGTRHKHLPILAGRMVREDLVNVKSIGKASRNGRYVFNGSGGLDLDKVRAGMRPSIVPSGTCFLNQNSDTFVEFLSFEDIAVEFALMLARRDVQWLVLTKRAERRRQWFEWLDVQARNLFGIMTHPVELSRYRVIRQFFGPPITVPVYATWPPPNIAQGVSVESRRYLDRIDELRDTPAAMRFLSVEPLLDDLGTIDLTGIDWVIAGAESGPGARPAQLDWFRSLRDECARQGVPFFLKQADICEGCGGSKVAGGHDAGGDCPRCGKEPGPPTGLAGKVRKGCPVLDGKVHDALPKWISGGAQ